MTRVLLIGAHPDAIDYSDPALPKDANAEKVWAGVEAALNDLRKRGWGADRCFIQPADPHEAVAATVSRELGVGAFDCIVVGGGIRLPPKMLHVFEAIVNAVHKGAPHAAIAFNTTPEDSGEAAARWVK